MKATDKSIEISQQEYLVATINGYFSTQQDIQNIGWFLHNMIKIWGTMGLRVSWRIWLWGYITNIAKHNRQKQEWENGWVGGYVMNE